MMQFIKDFQSLLAGLMTLVAAIIALRPVYKQLHANQIQTAIASRDLLFGRTRTIINRRRLAGDTLRSITDDFTARLYQGDPEGEPDIDITWAFEADQIVGQAIQTFAQQQNGMGDREEIDDKRDLVVQAAVALQQCLTAIHQFHTYDFDDPDNNWSAEETEQKRASAEAASKAAEKVLDSGITEVAKRGQDLDAAYAAELNEIRIRVRQINKRVLSEDHLP